MVIDVVLQISAFGCEGSRNAHIGDMAEQELELRNPVAGSSKARQGEAAKPQQACRESSPKHSSALRHDTQPSGDREGEAIVRYQDCIPTEAG